MPASLPSNLYELHKIGGLNTISIGGQEELEYRGEVIDSPLLLETLPVDLKHTKRGLLTRPKLAIGPEFAITLGPAPDLDGSHEVFGKLVEVRGIPGASMSDTCSCEPPSLIR